MCFNATSLASVFLFAGERVSSIVEWVVASEATFATVPSESHTNIPLRSVASLANCAAASRSSPMRTTPDPASIDALEQLELSLRRMATAFAEAADGAHDAVQAMQLMKGDEYLDARITEDDEPEPSNLGLCRCGAPIVKITNDYSYPDASKDWFVYLNGSGRTWTEWRGEGFDPNGTFTVSP